MLNCTKNDSVQGSVPALGKGAPGQWLIQGGGGTGGYGLPNDGKKILHLVIQITDRIFE